MSGDLHVPLRPEWICRVCAQLWPCEPKRGRLLAQYQDHPDKLRIYLADQAAVAAYDWRDYPAIAGRFAARITGWVQWPR